MDRRNHLDELIAQKIAGRFACNRCNRKYRVRGITTVEKWEQRWLLRLACAWCGAEELLSVVLRGQRAQAVLLDLTPDEWSRFRARLPVSADDVIDMARVMRDYTGDLGEILEDALPDEE